MDIAVQVKIGFACLHVTLIRLIGTVVAYQTKTHSMTNPVFLKNAFFLIVSMLLLSCAPKQAPSVSEPYATEEVAADGMEASILQYVNDHRRAKGLPSLQSNAVTNQQSYQHSKNMATGKTAFGHDGFEKRIETIKKSFGWISASSENVAYGKLSAKEVVKGWLNSPGHKKNIEGNYRYTGIGFYKDRKGVIYFTQIFFRS